MQKIRLTEYNIRRVIQDLLKVYVPMRRGEEDRYNQFFYCLDSNMLKLRRKDSKYNSRRAREAVDICLATINAHLHPVEYDLSEISNPENLALATAMQMAYDPYVDPEIAALASKEMANADFKLRFFEIPFKCLCRLRDSIDFWIQKDGSDGYFAMVEDEIGETVDRDEKMHFSLMVPE